MAESLRPAVAQAASLLGRRHFGANRQEPEQARFRHGYLATYKKRWPDKQSFGNDVASSENLRESPLGGGMDRQESTASAAPRRDIDGSKRLGMRGRFVSRHFALHRQLRKRTGACFFRSLYVLTYSVITIVGASLTSTCNARGDIIDHSFEFDALTDSPGVQILDHRYGDSNVPGTRNPDYRIKEGRPLQRTGITGPMKRPNTLYVKWRLVSENKVFEQTVDLRKRLPADLAGRKVYFLVKGPQLYVYLISQQPRPPGAPPAGPSRYQDRNVLTIYPDQKH
jgi:hypothetical protein